MQDAIKKKFGADHHEQKLIYKGQRCERCGATAVREADPLLYSRRSGKEPKNDQSLEGVKDNSKARLRLASHRLCPVAWRPFVGRAS